MIEQIYADIEDIPTDALDELKYEAISYASGLFDIDEIVDFLRDFNDYSGTFVGYVDSYFVRKYSCETRNFRFVVIGRRYVKDSCVCDEEMDKSIYITDLREESRQKEAEKIENSKKWDDLVSMIQTGDTELVTKILLDGLKKYKCPDEKFQCELE